MVNQILIKIKSKYLSYQKYNIPILSDISSNITGHPNIIYHYDLYIDKIEFDTVFRFGKKPLSKKLNALISKCKNTFLIRDERVFNDDTNKVYHIISYQISLIVILKSNSQIGLNRFKN